MAEMLSFHDDTFNIAQDIMFSETHIFFLIHGFLNILTCLQKGYHDVRPVAHFIYVTRTRRIWARHKKRKMVHKWFAHYQTDYH